MRLKSFLAGVGALFLFAVFLLPVSVQAADQSEAATTITTRVPDTHTVLLDIGEHGSVIINGTTYGQGSKSVQVERLKEQTYIIQPDDGWQVELVSYGQKDAQEEVKLTDQSFTAPIVNSDDNKLTVTFRKNSVSSGNDKDSPTRADKSGSTGVKTGDTTNVNLMSFLLLMSGIASFLLYEKKKREYKENRYKEK